MEIATFCVPEKLLLQVVDFQIYVKVKNTRHLF